MKKIRFCFVFFLFVLGLTACGRAAGANALISEAKIKHGSANVVSKTKTVDGYEIVLHDNLQNFDYTVWSYMDSVNIDGTEFWKQPGSSDNFEYALIDKIITDEQTAINNIETKYTVKLSMEYWPTVYANDRDTAKQAVCEIADIFQNNNLNNRLDDLMIRAIVPDSYYFDRTGYYDKPDVTAGYITLPSLAWTSQDQQLIEQYTYIAQELDPGSIYLRSEKMTFAHTGYNLDQVTLTGDAPHFKESPVTYYYFEASDGGEFYVADFCINDKYRPSEFFEANNYANRVYSNP